MSERTKWTPVSPYCEHCGLSYCAHNEYGECPLKAAPSQPAEPRAPARKPCPRCGEDSPTYKTEGVNKRRLEVRCLNCQSVLKTELKPPIPVDVGHGNIEYVEASEYYAAPAVSPELNWHDTVIEACIVNCIGWNETNPKKTLADLISWEVQVALDPAVSEAAAKLRDTYKAEPVVRMTDGEIVQKAAKQILFERESISHIMEVIEAAIAEAHRQDGDALMDANDKIGSLTVRLAGATAVAKVAESRVTALTAKVGELTATFDLMWAADQRAIKQWQEATGQDHIWPDRAKLTTWLLERNDALTTKLAGLRETLREHEWQHPPFSSSPRKCCYLCGARQEDGHESDCWLTAALSALDSTGPNPLAGTLAQLANYVRHRNDCDLRTPCRCGLDAVLASLPPASTSQPPTNAVREES
jgi:hypothetical protein